MTVIASSGSFLISPNVGLMVWTLLLFVISMVFLARLVFPRISAALDKRQQAIEDAIDTADETKRQAEELLAEYRERLTEARHQAEEIIERARKAGETHERTSEVGGARPRRAAHGTGQAGHRARDPAGHPGDPSRGRRSDRAGDREGDPQGALTRTISAS